MPLLRIDVVIIILGTIVLFMGVAAICAATIRRDKSACVLAWFGLFSALYGIRLFAYVPAAFALLAGPVARHDTQIVWIITYVIIIPALLFWIELSLGRYRKLLKGMTYVAGAIAIAGLIAVFALRAPLRFIAWNNILAIALLLTLAITTIVPELGKKYLAIRSPVSVVGTLVLAGAVLEENLRTFVALPHYALLEPIAFTIFVFSQGWVAAEKVFRDQRRLLSIEHELAIAREIQNSILPAAVPQLNGVKISAAYAPMTSVAGDFYWFTAIDPNRVGLLVADVSGHGVPAALIASMIKVALQSVINRADDPAAVLRGLDCTLSDQLRGQFVSAAYLLLDTENHKALYSAAGHPPLIRSSRGKTEDIESNGMILGVMPQEHFPVREIPITAGDLFVLYTDGVIEPENSKGESFGERRFAEIIRENESRSCSEISDRLLDELRRWQPTTAQQQDDITLLVVNIL